ncbi:hypothetical protein [Streptomyces achromogenes]|uniref:hypothetical protein n=1 Tax=Streptomyces achromogenes TaxID=67255 RepID=UPI000AE8042D|nr:hypothetical protein [Streptomyces achromogenes]
MTHDQEPEVVAVCHTASAIGRHFEELLTDGTVYAWTEPPFGETYYPGEDSPDYNPICNCPARARAGRRPVGGAQGRVRSHGAARLGPLSAVGRGPLRHQPGRDRRRRALHHRLRRRDRPAHPEVDWEQLRAVEKGQHSPLASLRPEPVAASA